MGPGGQCRPAGPLGNPCGPGTVMGPGGQCRPAGPLGNPCGPGTVMGPGGQCRPAGPLGNPCGPGSCNGSRRTMCVKRSSSLLKDVCPERISSGDRLLLIFYKYIYNIKCHAKIIDRKIKSTEDPDR